MNNLILGISILSLSAVLYFSQHASLAHVRRSNAATASELEEARTGLAELKAKATQAEALLADKRQELASARADLARAAAAADAVSSTPVDPASEGTWPASKPYFYLAKKHLSAVGYSPMTEDRHLSGEAATLFGMSPAEKASVDNTYQRFCEAVQQLQLRHAELLSSAPAGDPSRHQEISYRMPQLTNEFGSLLAQGEADVVSILGEERANLLLVRAGAMLNQTFGQFGNEGYNLTLIADRNDAGEVKHQLRFVQLSPNGWATYCYPVEFPLAPTSALWPFRHLFGQEPLLAGR